MPEPEPENVDPKPNPGALEDTKSDVKVQRAVSWLDGVDGKSLFTVGFSITVSCVLPLRKSLSLLLQQV